MLGCRFPLTAAFNSAVSSDTTADVVTPPAPVEKFRKDYAPLPWTVASISLNFNLGDGSSDSERATTVSSRLELAASTHHPGSPGEQ